MKDIDILEYLFGSKVASRLLKFLFRHPDESFRVGEIARLIDSNYNTTHSYIKKFAAIELITITNPPEKEGSPKEEEKSKKSKSEDDAANFFMLNPKFRLLEELKALVSKASPIAEASVVDQLHKLGRMRLVMLSGIFVGKDNVPIDLFVVGDDIEEEKFKKFISDLEADVGREINYTVMDTSEFTYRFNIYDRFVRNVFKYPHHKLIDRLSSTVA